VERNPSEQFDEFLDRQPGVFDDLSQQAVLERSVVGDHDLSIWITSLDDEMAAGLPPNSEADLLQCPDALAS
jgi:hypothetical protein